MAKYKYEYRCPDCGTCVELKMRVTLKARYCPECGLEITPGEIDRQRAEELRLEAWAKEEIAKRREKEEAEKLLEGMKLAGALFIGFFTFFATKSFGWSIGLFVIAFTAIHLVLRSKQNRRP